MALNFNKPLKTAKGQDVKILCTDAPGAYPVLGYLLPDGSTGRWTADGRSSYAGSQNLIQPKIKRFRWLKVDRTGGSLKDTDFITCTRGWYTEEEVKAKFPTESILAAVKQTLREDDE